MINTNRLSDSELQALNYFKGLRGHNFNIIYNFPKDFTLESIKQCYLPTIFKLFNVTCSNVSMILHDKDILENGTLKTPHLHIVLHYENRVYGSLILDTFSECIGQLFSPLQVTCKYCTSFRGSIRYLIHKDDIEKYQYDFNDILSNFEIDCYFEDIKNISIEVIESVCLSSKRLIDVYKTLGVKYTKQYFNVINKIWDLTLRDKGMYSLGDDYGNIDNKK